MSIPTRKIGNHDVPIIGFGSMGLSVAYGKVGTDEERLKILDLAYESGCTHWDTADIYGDSEDLLGKWFKKTGKRSEIFLATKFGISMTGMQGSPAYVRQQFENSLKRLGTDYIDLYYIHRLDASTPIEVTIGAMAELVKEGKVKYLGMSECTANGLRRAHAVHPISTLQIEYSPVVLDIEKDDIGLLKTARELGVKIVAYSPLGRGLLTGQIKSPDDFEADDARRELSKYSSPENFPKFLSLVNNLRTVGEKHNATPGQVALAWVLAQGEDFFAIPGTKKEKYLLENIGAGQVKLSKEEVQSLRKLAELEGDAIPGSRFQPGWKDFAYVDTPELKK